MSKYKFSFVMPVYNVEAYLPETVESILAQTMDFKENCEIIFVNDGSPDNVETVCLEYQKRFPDNIKYIKQENAGLSAARNRGIKEVEGKYVSFLDSDDTISPDTLEQVYNYFEENYNEIDFASIKQMWFEAYEGPHPLNYKFTRSRNVDIYEEYDMPQLSAASSFIKASVLKNHTFDDKIRRFAEDVKFLTELVAEKGKYGIIVGPIYNYRRRATGNSIVSSSQTDKYWYLGTPVDVYKYLFEFYKSKMSSVPRYVQFTVMYDLQWRFRQTQPTPLTSEELDQYRRYLQELLQEIDDVVIAEQRHLSISQKLYVLDIKYKGKLADVIRCSDGAYFIEDIRIYDFKTSSPDVSLQFIEASDDTVTLYGSHDIQYYDGLHLRFEQDGKRYDIELQPGRIDKKKLFLGEMYFNQNAFVVELPLVKDSIITAYLEKDGRNISQLEFKTHRFTGLDHNSNKAFVMRGKNILRKRGRDGILITSCTRRKRVIYEVMYDLALLRKKKLLSLAVRYVYFLFSLFFRRPIWLVSDRVNAGGDNGEALFRHLVENPPKGVNYYFVISKTSKDYARMKQIGKVVDRDSVFYKMLFLKSDKIISSHADDFVINAFGGKEHCLRDLFQFDFVFLQHGITKDDISEWLNRYNKNIKIFVAAAKPEYHSLLEPNYGYSEQQVKLTGFPRYDYLDNTPKGKLVIAPTWRRNLAIEADQRTGIRPYNEAFKSSDYFSFYQRLMDDKRVISALKAKNMTGEFYLHPSFTPQIKDFTGNEVVSVKDMPYDYREAFSEGDVMVTDFSSVAFDFAYLKKPVVYSQFDRKSFFGGHLYDQGYFSYEDDGFGPVCYDYEETVSQLVSIINGNCKMTDEYLNRVDNFFYRFDKENAKRVVDEILKLDKEIE